MIKNKLKKTIFSAVFISIISASVFAQMVMTPSGSYNPGEYSQRENASKAGISHEPVETSISVDEEAVHAEPTVSKSSKPAKSSVVKKTQPKKVKLTKEQKVAVKQAEKEEAEAQKKRAKILKKQKKDKYTGWIYIPEKKFSITNGDIKIYMDGRSGCFGLYAIPENLKPVSLISTYDSLSSTFFAVKIGDKIYRLNRENGVSSEARRTPYGAQMAYSISKKAQIVVDFSFLPSIASSSRVDMLRVTVYTINLGKRTQSFAVKSVFDTILGENTVSHFTTAAERKINTEHQYIDMKDNLWVRSASDTTSVQFLLNGKGISEPQLVTLASKDSLSKPAWIPSALESKSFNSALTYNNSALGINWKTAYLDPMKTDIITFYISVGTDGNEPAGKKFLSALAAGKTALSANLPDVIPTTTVAPFPESVDENQLITPYWENMPVVPESEDLQTVSPENNVQSIGYENNDSSSDYDLVDYQAINNKSDNKESSIVKNPVNTPDVNSKSDDKKVPHEASSSSYLQDPQLNPAYIQSLLDRIAALENNNEIVNQREIQMLNDELDMIFSKLRSLE